MTGGCAPRPSEQEQMEQAIRAELREVLATCDLESITSKEVSRRPGYTDLALRAERWPLLGNPATLLSHSQMPWWGLCSLGGPRGTGRGRSGGVSGDPPSLRSPLAPHCRSARPWSYAWAGLWSSTETSSTTRRCCSWPSRTRPLASSPTSTW